MVALVNHEVQIFDVLGRTIVRRFVGHSASITDLVFSQDGRRVISASKDLSIRTWDMATGLQLDVLELPSVPISISLSPKLDFLAVVLEDDVAVHIWTNVSMYKPVAFQHHLPSSIEPVVDKVLSGLVNLSLEPRSKSVNLFHLDSIKARNKPVLPPKATEQVPFFLDALLGSSGNQKRDANGAKKNEAGENSGEGNLELCLAEMLKSEAGRNQAFDYLKSMGPSAIDLEIQSLIANSSQELDSILALIRMMTHKIEQRMDYELAVTFLNVILKAHAQLILSYPSEFHSVLQDARNALRSTWSNLEALFHESLCLTQFARSN
jgi:U3 small nucleolar RNA-associated protein 21